MPESLHSKLEAKRHAASVENAAWSLMHLLWRNREHLVQEWLTETGVLPSEAELVEEWNRDGSVTIRVRRRHDLSNAPSRQEVTHAPAPDAVVNAGDAGTQPNNQAGGEADDKGRPSPAELPQGVARCGCEHSEYLEEVVASLRSAQKSLAEGSPGETILELLRQLNDLEDSRHALELNNSQLSERVRVMEATEAERIRDLEAQLAHERGLPSMWREKWEREYQRHMNARRTRNVEHIVATELRDIVNDLDSLHRRTRAKIRKRCGELVGARARP